MSHENVDVLTVQQLVERPAAIGVEQEDAVWDDNNDRYTRLFRQMDEVKNELKRRHGDQRRVLLGLYDHPSVQVRLMAAKATLAVAPNQARRMIETIADSHLLPQAGDAGMCLWALDEGIFVPD